MENTLSVYSRPFLEVKQTFDRVLPLKVHEFSLRFRLIVNHFFCTRFHYSCSQIVLKQRTSLDATPIACVSLKFNTCLCKFYMENRQLGTAESCRQVKV